MTTSGDNDIPGLGSVILSSIRDALNSPEPLIKVDTRLLIKLADKQGLNDYAADVIKEIKRRESQNEECWVLLTHEGFYVYGEVVEVREGDRIPMVIESFSGPATFIRAALTESDIVYLSI